MEALRAGLTMVLGILLPLAVQLWDRHRLPPERARFTWEYATWGGALYAFGPLSMLGWIFVTRRPWWRCLVAIPYTLAPLLGLVAIDLGFARALGEPIEEDASDLVALVLIGSLVIAAVMLVIEVLVHAQRRARRRPSPAEEWRAREAR